MPAPKRELPTGTVTFLFTDIEGSTKLVHQLGSEFRGVLEDHHRILREAIHAAGGVDRGTEGDAFFAVFPTADDAVRAAVTAQRGLAAHDWPEGARVRVRMGLHTGQGALGGDDYVGIDVHRAARIAATGHGGQIVISAATAALCEGGLPGGVSLKDLGRHRLKDLPDPEHLRQLVVEELPSEFPPLRSLEIATNLPVYPTRFVGRHADVSALRERLLSDARLVTVTGPGGTGKTRLSVEVARAVAERYPGGVTFVDLAAITEPHVVGLEIASELGVEAPTPAEAIPAVAEALRDRTMLLVLDNFEQVVDAAGDVATLIAGAPAVDVLVTSREALALSGEHLYPLAPLGLAEGNGAGRGLSDAVELFVDRARAVDPAFEPDAPTIEAVAAICARLDGMPLAIELAASRIRMLTAADLLDRLDRRLPLLTGGPRDAPARQQTLRAAIEWSHDLLDEPERALFRRLGVFAGGWSGGRGLRVAEEVANPDGALGDALDLLASLVQKSLVRRDPGTGRFAMYETIREFALERLEEAGELAATRERHARQIVALAEHAGRELSREGREAWLERLSENHDNIRAALDWAIESDEADVGLRIGAGLWRFWQLTRGIAEGRARLADVLALPSARRDPAVRARALSALGGLHYWGADYEAMARSYQEALDLARPAGDPKLLADALADAMFIHQIQGDHPKAKELLDEALAIYEAIGDEAGLAFVHLNDAYRAVFAGDRQAGAAAAERAVPLLRAIGDVARLPEGLSMLALAAVERGDLPAAFELMREVVEVNVRARSWIGLAISMYNGAVLAGKSGRHEMCARLLGAERAVARAYEVTIPEWGTEILGWDPAADASRVLGEEQEARLEAEGEALEAGEAIRLLQELLAEGPEPA